MEVLREFAGLWFNTKQARLFADWYGWGGGGGGGGEIRLLLCTFCLDGSIDLKFGMWIVLGKMSRYGEKSVKNCQKVAQNAYISIF